MKIGTDSRRLVGVSVNLRGILSSLLPAEGNPDEEKIGAFGVGTFLIPVGLRSITTETDSDRFFTAFFPLPRNLS